MSKNNIKAITLTILTESPVALSNDQGFGNYTPIKKSFRGDGVHAITSVATITYEMKKQLVQKGWQLSGMVLNTTGKDDKKKVTNMYPYEGSVDANDELGLETDIFGFLIPDKQLSKTSPLRIIPFESIHTYKNDLQLITNRGFLDHDMRREYYNKDGNKYIDELPTTQALANEEIFGDYYVYTITIELDRFGVQEVKEGKYLAPEDRVVMSKDIRKKALKDIIEVITELTRGIKHQSVHLKPLAVFGGAFENVIPYFWNDMKFNDNKLILDYVQETIESYELKRDNYIVGVSRRLETIGHNEKIEVDEAPVKVIKDLVRRLEIREDNKWYFKEGN
ncbi:type I-B CRISPR-associated protein Cas7/Cst2/DevR [Irregularibacter muris]|uniref:Type I-B CRISPR-associated protein Cas7/Cst2/DevR n=1 Tax=Irregularibacter muris TaxID=1796619 RepID=A0AAE3HH86_9FIRM|nr:type I-B CRISPR-associated protein Cas7/Cst2/DevR [Irregularibacter muris]MCR1900131.1 type I-B CRISPR-associated protein Cas7/Cst2/DevR [Irregularibacter muris]